MKSYFRKTLLIFIVLNVAILYGCNKNNGTTMDTSKNISSKSSVAASNSETNIDTTLNTNSNTQSIDNSSDLKTKLNKAIDTFYKKNKFNGAILIAKDNDIILNNGYGYENHENDIKVTPQSKFEIASLTKQFTSVAILMLEEKGLLSLDDTISKYIPDFPYGDSITIFHLLTHTSGLRDIEDIEDYSDLFSSSPPYIPDELTQIVIKTNTKLSSEPGQKYCYADSNYFLLGKIIEKITGETYENFITKNILIPLDMTNSGFIDPDTELDNMAYSYKYHYNSSSYNHDETNYSYEKVDTLANSYFYSAGAMYSTTTDLLKWCNSLYSATLLKESSIDKMLTPYLNDYGLGVKISTSSNGDKIITHTGSLLGYGSVLTMELPEKYTVIFLYSHDADKKYTDLSKSLLSILNH